SGWVAIGAVAQATIQIHIVIVGKRELCLISTGEKIPLRRRGNKAECKPCMLAVRAAGGYRLKIDGFSNHSMRLGDRSVQHEFLISPHASAFLRMIRRSLSRIARMGIRTLADLVLDTPTKLSIKDARRTTLSERVKQASAKMVTSRIANDYKTHRAVLGLFPREYHHLRRDLMLTYALVEQSLVNRGDLILTYALFEQGSANRFFTVDPANTRRGHGKRQPLNDENQTDPGNVGGTGDCPIFILHGAEKALKEYMREKCVPFVRVAVTSSTSSQSQGTLVPDVWLYMPLCITLKWSVHAQSGMVHSGRVNNNRMKNAKGCLKKRMYQSYKLEHAVQKVSRLGLNGKRYDELLTMYVTSSKLSGNYTEPAMADLEAKFSVPIFWVRSVQTKHSTRNANCCELNVTRKTACTDEVKVYKDEGEEDEQKKSSENLTEDKVGLVIEGEGQCSPKNAFNFGFLSVHDYYHSFSDESSAYPKLHEIWTDFHVIIETSELMENCAMIIATPELLPRVFLHYLLRLLGFQYTECGLTRARDNEVHFWCMIYSAFLYIIIDSMTSVFNTDASLPYNHGLFESLIVKKRIKMDGEGTYCCLTTIIPRCLHLQTLIQAIWIETDNKIATDIGWQPYLPKVCQIRSDLDYRDH
ncbi:pangolin, partial [Clonorchis sinensis]